MHDDPTPLDPIATVATVVVAASMVVFATYRVVPVDVPWHLATGRWILEHGFMTTNTFSWTHPEHPLYQQYPLFQVPIALLTDTFGYEALSLWFGAVWAGALVAWMRWGAPFRSASAWPLLWLGAAVGLQRHAVQRPEAHTILFLGLMLIALDHWRRTGKRRGLVATVFLQWCMANSHQLFPLGLVVQFGVWAQLLAVRYGGTRLGLDPTDRDRPLGPISATLAASTAILALSPLGLRIFLVPLQTLATVMEQGAASGSGNLPGELAPVWTDPLAFLVALLVGGWFLLTTARTRGHWRLDEVGVGLLGLVMTAAALRGISFLGVTCAAAAVRMAARRPALLPRESLVHPASTLGALGLAASLVWLSLASPPILYGSQRGLGKAIGGWGEDLCQALHDAPPPGEVLNLGWAAGNPLIGCAFPEKRPFVDPRFEAYPSDFLWKGTEASSDPAILRELIDTWSPGFVVVEMRLQPAHERLAELVDDGWGLTHLDADFAVAVPPGPYLDAHRLTDWSFRSPVDDYPVLRAQQLVHHAALLARLEVGDSEHWLALAREVEHPLITSELEQFGF